MQSSDLLDELNDKLAELETLKAALADVVTAARLLLITQVRDEADLVHRIETAVYDYNQGYYAQDSSGLKKLNSYRDSLRQLLEFGIELQQTTEKE